MTLPEKYTRPAIVLHWVVAVLIVCNVLLMWSVDCLPKAGRAAAAATGRLYGMGAAGGTRGACGVLSADCGLCGARGRGVETPVPGSGGGVAEDVPLSKEDVLL
jgi:tetrahydromethanopterin S-methyltransferase subunit D